MYGKHERVVKSNINILFFQTLARPTFARSKRESLDKPANQSNCCIQSIEAVQFVTMAKSTVGMKTFRY